MYCFVFHHWSKLETILTTFRGITSRKTTQKQPEMVLSAAKKTFET